MSNRDDILPQNNITLKNCVILSKEEQIRLLYAWKQNNDSEALNKLVLSQLRLAYQIADNFGNSQLSEELKAEAGLSVIEAIRIWRPERGALSTIVTTVVRQRLYRYLKQLQSNIYIPYNTHRTLRQLTDGEIILEEESPITKTRIQDAKIAEKTVLFSEVNKKQLNNSALQQVDDVEDQEIAERNAQIIKNIDYLDYKTSRAIKEFYGINCKKKTLRQIAVWYGAVPQTISRRIKNGLLAAKVMGFCKHCHCKFQPNKRNKNFCSSRCNQVYNSLKKVSLGICTHCSKVFIRCREFRKFCSISCRNKHRKCFQRHTISKELHTLGAV